MNSSEPVLGGRFQVGKERGKVMFKGILPNIHPTEIWVGVDWDNQSRGKHDGTVKGVRYFTASRKTSGSFLKLKKFVPKCKRIESFVEAIKERYIKANQMFLESGNSNIHTLSYDDEDDDLMEEGEEKKKRRKGRVNIELVGMGEIAKKLADLKSLSKVSLPDRFVQTIDIGLAETLPKLTSIDLSHTLIFDLGAHVLSLVRQLKNLRSLNISENRFHLDPRTNYDEEFDHLKLLVMNRCRLTYSDVLYVAKHFPSLTELHFCGNNLEDLDSSGKEEVEGEEEEEEEEEESEEQGKTDLPKTLEAIHIASNGLKSFENVLVRNSKISTLPNLRTVNLNNNEFTHIPSSMSMKNRTSTSFFPKLEHLALAKNKFDQLSTSVDIIRDWTSIKSLVLFGNELGKTVELEKILDRSRFDFMTIREREKETLMKIRLLVIGKMGGIEYLNRSEVTKSERNDNEKYYLNRFYFELGEDERMKELIEKYPGFVNPNVDPEKEQVGKKKKSILPININFLGDEHLQQQQQQQEEEEECTLEFLLSKVQKKKKKKLKLSMTVGQLKVLCKRLFKVDNLDRVKVFFMMKGRKKVVFEEDDSQLGGSYGMNEDVKDIFVCLVDLEKEKKKVERMKREFDQSILNQEEQIYKKLEWQKKNQYY